MIRGFQLYAFAGCALILALMPGFLGKLGTQRRHPLALNGRFVADGTLRIASRLEPPAGALTVTSVSIDNGERLPPGSLAVLRSVDSLPVGTPIRYDILGAGGPVLEGRVIEAPAELSKLALAISRAFLALVFCVSGAALAFSVTDRRGALCGAALSSVGVLLGSTMLEPNLVQIADARWRNFAILVWQAFPRDLAFLMIVLFLAVFPGRLRLTPFSKALSRAILVFGLASWGYLFVGQIPGFLECLLSIRAQVLLYRAGSFLKPSLFLMTTLASLLLIRDQTRLYRRLELSRADRTKARFVGVALLVAVVPTLSMALLQSLLLLTTGHKVIGTIPIASCLTLLVLAPIALARAILAGQIPSFGLLVRRAALFGFSEKTVRVAALVPLALLLAVLYRHRDVPIGDLLRDRPVFLGLMAAGASIGLLYGDRARHALEGVFFRDRADARRVMGELAEKSRAARDPASLEQLLSGEIGRALHAESVALFVRDRVSGAFVCPSRNLPTLDADSVLLGAAGTRGVLDLDPSDRRSPLGSLPEIERHWVEASHARLVLPLSGADGGVIGLLTVGENLSELPWDKDDKSLLVAAAASGALALENSLLRSSGGAGTALGKPAAVHEEEDLARTCHLCSQIFSAALGPLCPKDQVPLKVADVPHVLAGKYRFERRIGSGGMGVVYLARDLSLGRFVAVKTLPKVSPEAAMRLRREARATARVLHPNLAVIFAAETWHGTPMLMLEYLEGGTLAPRIARGPIPIAHVLEWGIALSGALDAAHAKGVLHRDIKPSNIGFTASDEPKLLDFGLASLLEEPELLAAVETTGPGFDALETVDLKHKTVSGRIVGTVPYLAPEAILGQPPQVSFDLWSLALTLYEATTGTNPFLEMPAEKTLNRILTQTPPRARDLRAECPEGLSDLFANALALKPAQRPRTARELHRALRALASPAAA